MPIRKVPLVTGEYYHVFNRGVNKQPIFTGKRDYVRALETLKFYLPEDPPVRYSKFMLTSKEEREKILSNMNKRERIIDIISYCFMPNHFHLLAKQNKDRGITKFMRNFQISYTLFFNLKYERTGPLLTGQFKAVRVEDDEQLLHTSRYIHLNPYTSFIVQNFQDLETYPYSSLTEYLGKNLEGICDKEIILSNFKDTEVYKKFLFDQADYQQKLEQIKHLLLE